MRSEGGRGSRIELKVEAVALDLFRLNLAAEPANLPPGSLEVERLLAAGLGWNALCLLATNPLDRYSQSLVASQTACAMDLIGLFRTSRFLLEDVPDAALGNLRLFASWAFPSSRAKNRFLSFYPDELLRICRFHEVGPTDCTASESELLLTGLATVIHGEPDEFGDDDDVSAGWHEMRQLARARRAFGLGEAEWPTDLEESQHGLVLTFLAMKWEAYYHVNPYQAVSWLEREVRNKRYHKLVNRPAILGITSHRRLFLTFRALANLAWGGPMVIRLFLRLIKSFDDKP